VASFEERPNEPLVASFEERPSSKNNFGALCAPLDTGLRRYDDAAFCVPNL
jgi:hypothetical protein